MPALANTADTIAAIATPRGFGGIGIVRISGPAARALLSRLFQAAPAQGGPFAFTPRKLHHGWVLDAQGQPLDEILAVYMPAPHSFTGEDTAEIHCHGGKAVTEAVLEAALAAGARLAEPGEFTRRAFLNGRLDLTQAEAVAEMIAAPTLTGVKLARNKLAGALTRRVNELRERLDALRALLYLALDFPDEQAEDLEATASERKLNEGLAFVRAGIAELLAAYDRTRLWREGALAVLAGRVNVGKSSLLNALLGRERAIVSARPGTTRDFIEESLVLDGLPLRLTDTAGLRETTEEVEEEGLRLARGLYAEADLLMLVLDAAQNPDGKLVLAQEELELVRLYGPASGRNKILLVLNKTDLAPTPALPASLRALPCEAVSARTGLGLTFLTAHMRQILLAGQTQAEASDSAAPNLRQSLALKAAQSELSALTPAALHTLPAELLTLHLDAAAAELAGILGLSSTEEILDQVFANFCIGK